MEKINAVAALAALAQDNRLDVFRLLVEAGPEGMPAGEIAAALDLAPNTLTFHFDRLRAAELVTVRRDGRSMIYAARFETMTALLGFLTDNCCSGAPEKCLPALRAGQGKKAETGDRMTDRPYNVLFLCTGNSARSIIAEAILNREGRGNFRAHSAGSQPKGVVHPYTLDLLRKLNFDVGGFRSKNWSEFAGADKPPLDFVFTVCDNAAGEACPYWPGQPMTAHWGVPDPAAATGNEAEVRLAFADTFRMLSNRISIFVSLPFRSLDKLTLQRQLDSIGKSKDSAA
jgi:protein-tyrosine-phosphatase/DNA-binding transcriptional ArsR family regulator